MNLTEKIGRVKAGTAFEKFASSAFKESEVTLKN